MTDPRQASPSEPRPDEARALRTAAGRRRPKGGESGGSGRAEQSTPRWFDEGMWSLAKVANDRLRGGDVNRAIVEQAATVVTGRMWWDLTRHGTDGTCDDLDEVARALEALGPAFGRGAGEIAEVLARSIGLPEPVVRVVGWAADGMVRGFVDQQMWVAAMAIRALGVGLCGDRYRSADLDQRRRAVERCACVVKAPSHAVDERVTEALRTMLSISLGIPLAPEAARDDRARAIGVVHEATRAGKRPEEPSQPGLGVFSPVGKVVRTSSKAHGVPQAAEKAKRRREAAELEAAEREAGQERLNAERKKRLEERLALTDRRRTTRRLDTPRRDGPSLGGGMGF